MAAAILAHFGIKSQKQHLTVSYMFISMIFKRFVRDSMRADRAIVALAELRFFVLRSMAGLFANGTDALR